MRRIAFYLKKTGVKYHCQGRFAPSVTASLGAVGRSSSLVVTLLLTPSLPLPARVPLIPSSPPQNFRVSTLPAIYKRQAHSD